MHHITKTIQDLISQCDVALKDRAKATELLVSEGIAATLSLPTSPTDNPQTVFLAQCKLNALEKLTKVNEHVVIDVDRALDLVYRIWLLRYSLVHRMNDRSVGRLLSLAICGNKDTIPGTYVDLLAECPDMFLTRYQIQDSEELTND